MSLHNSKCLGAPEQVLSLRNVCPKGGPLTTEIDSRRLHLKVSEVLGTDVGRGFARLDQVDMTGLQLEQGQLVRLDSAAGKLAFAKCFYATTEQERLSPASVRIDGMTRAALGVEIGQEVVLTKAPPQQVANYVILRLMAGDLSDYSGEEWGRIALEDKPIWRGANVVIPHQGQALIFLVVSVAPHQEGVPFVVTMRTRIDVEGVAADRPSLIEVYIDGLAEPTNPGTGTYGFVIYKDGARIKEGYGLAGREVTNNFAEYEALVQALTTLKGFPAAKVRILSDSQLLVNQMRGEWKAKRGTYLAKYAEARKLADAVETIEFKWIPREKNDEADELTRIAYRKYSVEQGSSTRAAFHRY